MTMSYAHDSSKARPPRGIEVYPRTRLFRWLDNACVNNPIVWIAGPPGAGKTALINSYLAYRDVKHIGYVFHQSDSSLTNLHANLERHLHAYAHPESDLPGQPNVTGDSSRPVSGGGIINELCTISNARVIVFEGCEELADDSDSFQYLSDDLEHLPEGRTAFFISRSVPPPSFARWSVDRRMIVLGWDELRLTPEESQGIARLHGCTYREDSAVRQAHELAAGWLAGLLLLLQEVMSQRQSHAPLASRAEKNIHDYFQAEIFGRLDAQQQEFLMATALLQGMTEKMVEQLTGDREARKTLADLCHKHYFTDRHAQQNDRYQYHPLFRKFLLTKANVCLAHERLAGLQCRAAEILEDNGHLERAAMLLINAQAWESLLSLIARHFDTLLRQGRTQTVESWLLALPEPIISAAPWALYWLGVCQLTHCDRYGCADFSRAYALFDKEGNVEGILLSWAGTIDALLAAHEYRELDQWIDRMDEYMAVVRNFPSLECEHRVAASMFSALLYRHPGRRDLGEWQERVKSCLHQSGDSAQIIAMSRRLLQYQIWFGSAAACAVIMDTVRILAQLPDQGPDILIQCGLAECEYFWFTASFEECLKAVKSTRDIARDSGMHRWDIELCGLAVSASMGLSNHPEAQGWLQKMSISLYQRPRYETAQYHLFSAWCEMASGDAESAFEHADTARRMFVDSGAILDQALTDVGLAHISSERGDTEIAAAHLDAARELAASTGSSHLSFLCNLIHWSLDSSKGTRESTRNRLVDAFALGSQFDYQNTFWWQRKLVAQASSIALTYGIEVDYVKSIVRRHELTLDNPPIHISNWPWLLKIYTLGRFSLLKYDQPLWASRKAQHKPLELLKVLIAFGGREVSVDLLASVLWPDAEGDAGKNSFDITLHRLRKLIGADKVLVLRDGRLTLDSRYCWVDTWALERMIGQVDLALRSDRQDSDVIMQMSSAILALYQGHYLDKEYSQPWSLNLRERLRSKYLRHVTDMAHYLEKDQRWEDAIVYYQKGLEVDDLAEQFYQSFMICYQKLGRRSEALAVYRRCRNALSIILGIEPSPLTESIHKSLLS